MILAPTYHFSLATFCSIFYHACLVFKQNIIYLFLLPAVGCLRRREEKRREENIFPIIMYFLPKVFSPLSFSFVLTNKTPAILPMATSPYGFPG